MSIEQGGSTTHQFGYNYDRNKNIITRSQNGAVDQYTYDPSNRIQSEAGTQNETYSYDANGNRLDKGSGKIFGLKNAEYTYDSQNRLKKVVGEGKTVSYTYNGDGLLYERTEGEQITRHYYDEEAKLIAEAKVSSSGKADISYMYIYDLYGQLWARQDKESGKLKYYQLNGHGDVVGLVDANGKTLNSYTYDIWGGPLIEEETVPNTLRYAGEYWDDTTGLQYLRARWYDPGTARFMGEDTYEGDLTNPLSLNLYAYVGNNPLIYVDPSGNVWKWVDNGWKMVKRGAKATADFLIMDDLRTLSDPNSSLFDKGMAVAGFIPIGKFAKGGKLVVKWSNKSGKVVEKAVKICNCFTAGTEVQTDEGEKPIEEIEVGDKVLAKSDETGEVAYKEVLGLFQKQADEIYSVHIGDEIIEATGEHPFWLNGKDWTLVKDLKVGDLLVSSDGTTLAIDKIEKEPREATVYNFEVADFHSYFVSNLGIWVHNCNISFSVGDKAFKDVKKKWGQKGVDAFLKSANKGLVGGTGQNGIKVLSGGGVKMGGIKYTHEIKVLNKEYGDYRIYGYMNESGKLVFDKLGKGLH